MKILSEIYQAIKPVFASAKECIDRGLYDYRYPTSCMSYEAFKIFAHAEDRAKYIEAVRRLKTEASVTIRLHSGDEIILTTA